MYKRQQYAVNSFEELIVPTYKGIVGYLSSGSIKGITDVYKRQVMDRGKTTQIDINGKKVTREIPTIEFASDDISSFVKPTCISYFTSRCV